jgi:hypothetical protein
MNHADGAPNSRLTGCRPGGGRAPCRTGYVFSVFAEFLPLPARDERGGGSPSRGWQCASSPRPSPPAGEEREESQRRNAKHIPNWSSALRFLGSHFALFACIVTLNVFRFGPRAVPARGGHAKTRASVIFLHCRRGPRAATGDRSRSGTSPRPTHTQRLVHGEREREREPTLFKRVLGSGTSRERLQGATASWTAAVLCRFSWFKGSSRSAAGSPE